MLRKTLKLKLAVEAYSSPLNTSEETWQDSMPAVTAMTLKSTLHIHCYLLFIGWRNDESETLL